MSNSTVVASSEYSVPQFESLPTPAGSNGGVYNAGFVTGQNSAASQNSLINATKGGKKRRFIGGVGEIAVPAVPVAYNDGGQTQGLVANMTNVTATQNAQSQYDSKVTIKGGKRSRGNKRERSRGNKRRSRRGNKSRSRK